jgi:DNA polymerase elongation subunit (family B)
VNCYFIHILDDIARLLLEYIQVADNFPQIGLHEDVLALDYDSEYANLIVNHNLSYETVCGSGEARKGLLPTVVERFLKGRIYFKKLLKELPEDSTEYTSCDGRAL